MEFGASLVVQNVTIDEGPTILSNPVHIQTSPWNEDGSRKLEIAIGAENDLRGSVEVP